MTVEELTRAAEEFEIVEYDGIKYTVNALVKKIRVNPKGNLYWGYSVELRGAYRFAVVTADPERVHGTGEYTFPRIHGVQYAALQKDAKSLEEDLCQIQGVN